MVPHIDPVQDQCPNCKQTSFITDAETGEVYCSNCGVVIQDIAFEFARVSESGYSLNTSDSYAPSNTKTLIGSKRQNYGLSRRLRTIDYRDQLDRYRYFKKVLDKFSDEYNVPQHIRDDALRVFKNSILNTKHYNIKCKVMASVVWAYEINNQYFNYRRVTNFRRRIFNKCLRIIKKDNPISYRPKSYKDYLPYYVRRLSLTSEQLKEIESCIKTYKEYSWGMKNKLQDYTVVVSSIYYIIRKYNYAVTVEDLGEISGTHPSMLSTTYKIIKECVEAPKTRDSLSKGSN
jgi:transcription initiation factor TFIIIB Brf1 subunit/transcription initiation factor TFIIB